MCVFVWAIVRAFVLVLCARVRVSGYGCAFVRVFGCTWLCICVGLWGRLCGCCVCLCEGVCVCCVSVCACVFMRVVVCTVLAWVSA